MFDGFAVQYLRRTFSDKLCTRNALLDLAFVGEVCIRHEGAVEARPEVIVPLRVLTAEEEEFCDPGVQDDC